MNKTITILGNSGKTVLAYYLAQRLSEKDKKVMIVSTNNATPDFSLLFPDANKMKQSLGRVLSLAIINQESIIDNTVVLVNPNIGYMMYRHNENKNTYPSITSTNIESFFAHLSNLMDFIIIDTQTERNVIDIYAIEMLKGINVCVTTADLKGFAYRQQLPEGLPVTHVLYNNNKLNPYEDMKHTFSLQVKHHMPFCPGLQYLYNGATLKDLSACPKQYKKFLDKLLKEMNEQ